MENKHSLAVVLLTAVFALYIGESAAQTGGAYPNRQVKIVVTLPPGGAGLGVCGPRGQGASIHPQIFTRDEFRLVGDHEKDRVSQILWLTHAS